ncbi:MAG TPA: copper chaperone PCu(A)C [Frateuria sp.]|uniref:copper chaperone PCu(A)C n=1 Tax=Frateuria sp. TaxID=2211372 RepID=UPI002DE97893|nr:copper chaperone PCu(A)C [Frateuria sp.]
MRPSPLSLLLAGLLCVGTAHAGEAAHVHAVGAWIRVLPGALPAGGYVTLRNDGDQPAVLTGASSPAYGSVMLHQSSTETGMGRMRMVDRLEVPAHGQVALSPGGYHLMLMDAAGLVQPGQTVRVSLRFADGSTLATDFLAKPANAL